MNLQENETKQVQAIPAGMVVNIPRRDQLRMNDEELQQLLDSIDQDGLHEPIVVRPVEGGFAIVDGRHRSYCLRELKRFLPCIVREDLDEKSALVATIITNLARKDMPPLEEAHAFKDAIDGGLTQVELSKRVGVPQPRISKRLKLLQLPEPIALLAGKAIGVEDAAWWAFLEPYPVLTGFVVEALQARAERDGRLVEAMSYERILREATYKKGAELVDPFDQEWIGKLARKPSWKFYSLVSSGAYRTKFKDLKHVVFGAHSNAGLYEARDDTAATVKQAAETYLANKDKARSPAKNSAATVKPEIDWTQRLNGAVREETRRRHLERLRQRLDKIQGLEDITEVLAMAVLQADEDLGRAMEEDEVPLLRDIVGDAADLWTEGEWENGEVWVDAEKFQQLRQRSPTAAVHALMVVAMRLFVPYRGSRMLDEASRALLGETPAQTRSVAERRANATIAAEKAAAEKEAKKPAKAGGGKTTKDGKEGAATKAAPPAKKAAKKTPAATRRAEALDHAKEYPHACVWGGCNERFKTKPEQGAHLAKCPVRLKWEDERPAAVQLRDVAARNAEDPSTVTDTQARTAAAEAITEAHQQKAKKPKIKRHHKGKECPECLGVLNIVDGVERCLFCNPLEAM